MTDTVDAETRGRIMASVPTKNTSLEMFVRREVHRAGYRYVLHRRDLPGCPDLVFPRHRLAVFVHGCFWHGHGCHLSRLPASHVDFWTAKIERNRARDRQALEALTDFGWRTMVIWQCECEDGLTTLRRMLAAGPPLA